MRDLLTRVFAALAKEILRVEGTIDKYVGDAVMAVFGAPRAHEDDAVRGIAAALAMHKALDRMTPMIARDYGLHLYLRIGVNSGEVAAGVIADAAHWAYTVVGDAVNTAQRLQAAAKPGETLVSSRTRELASDAFEFVGPESLAVKHKSERIAAFRVVRARVPAPSDLPPSRVPLVGRDDELGRLETAIRRVAAGHGGLTAVLGEAGIGKTRLINEVRRSTQSGVDWFEARARPLDRGSSYRPLSDVFRSLLGIQAERETTWQSLRASLVRVMREDADDAAPYLATLLDVDVPEEIDARLRALDGEDIKRHVFRFSRLLVERAAAARPLVLLLEDWDTADASAQLLLEHLLPLTDRLHVCWSARSAREGTAFRLITVCRASYADRYEEIALGRLDDGSAAELLGFLLDTAAVANDVRAAVIPRAEGNPLFLEQIARSLRDSSEVLTDTAGTVSSEIATRVPDTINAAITARVDALTPDAREVVRAASIIGRTFSRALLRTIVDPAIKLEECLRELLEVQLIRPSRAELSGEYEMTHALIQEVVYDGMLLRRRRELHRRVAECIEEMFADRPGQAAAVLADHYARAEDWGRAHRNLIRAGERAGRPAGDAEAVAHYEGALALYSRALGKRWSVEERAHVERKVGEARFGLGQYDVAATHLQRALALLGHRRPRGGLLMSLAVMRETARQALHRALPALFVGRRRLRSADEDALLALRTLALIDFTVDSKGLLHSMLTALNASETVELSLHRAGNYAGVGFLCHNLGFRAWGRRYCDMAVESSKQLDDDYSLATGEMAAGFNDEALGQWGRALEHFSAAARTFHDLGHLRLAGIADVQQIAIWLARGEFDELVRKGNYFLRLADETGDRQFAAWGHHTLGMTLGRCRSPEVGARHLLKAIDLYRSVPDDLSQANAYGFLTHIYLMNGEDEAARSAAQQGFAIVASRDLRGWYLTALYQGAADLSLIEFERASLAERPALASRAKYLCVRALRQTRLHVEAGPAAHRSLGTLHWLNGSRELARRSWQQSLAAAEPLAARWELALTYREIGQRTGAAAERERGDELLDDMRAHAGRLSKAKPL